MKFILNIKRRIYLSMILNARRRMREVAKNYNKLLVEQPPHGYIEEIIETKSGIEVKYKFYE